MSAPGNPQVWEHMTRVLLPCQIEGPETFHGGDVFALTCVEPLPEYGLQDGDGPDEWTMTAECLYAIGYHPLHVIEIWSSWRGAAAVVEEHLKNPRELHSAIMIVPFHVGVAHDSAALAALPRGGDQ